MKKIICAIDTSDLNVAHSLLKSISCYIDVVKLGLEFFTSCGMAGVEAMAELGLPIFLDLKLHDIPNTVKKTLEVIKKIRGIKMITVHITGGGTMMQEAKKVLSGSQIKLLGVSVLTSLEESDLKCIGVAQNIQQYVQNLAIFGKKNGIDGVICSIHEANLIKKVCGEDFIIVTPGIGQNSDQKRSADISELEKYNADYIVIGRAITKSENPADAAKHIHSVLKLEKAASEI